MEQHPIPQNISSYEFKLVGEMTLKQFFKAGGGIVLALLVNSTKLIFFIKWPLMAIFGLGGVALAFLPFEERPLETWLMAFLRSIYGPTIYTYKRAIGDSDWLDNQLGQERIVPQSGTDVLKEEDETGKAVGVALMGFGIKRKKKKTKEEVVEILNSLKGPSAVQDDSNEKGTSKDVDMEVEEKVAEDWKSRRTNLQLEKEKLGATGEANFGEIPMPDIPEVPNLIVGMVTDKSGRMVEGAILEIQDKKGNPVRVLKTNALGQFRSSTALADGTYLIIPEKEGYNFDRINVELTNKIVAPVKIQAIA